MVLSESELRDIVDLCERRGILLISDEIYDAFTYPDFREGGRCPSPARMTSQMLLIRGFGKTYGCTGWRLGYAAGPRGLMQQMAKIQQYTFVCAPSMAQAGGVAAFDVNVEPLVEAYQRRRDMVLDGLGDVARISTPGGAFYAFVEVPERLGITGSEFLERAIAEDVLIIPGRAFSARDTHFRISYAVPEERLAEGIARLRRLLTEAPQPRAADLIEYRRFSMLSATLPLRRDVGSA